MNPELQEYLDKLTEVRDGLDEKIQEAHGLTRDMRDYIRVINEAEDRISEAKKSLEEMTKEKLDALISAIIIQSLDKMMVEMKDQMNKSVEHIKNEFTKLERLFLGKDKDGPSIEELVVRARQKNLHLKGARPDKNKKINDPLSTSPIPKFKQL